MVKLQALDRKLLRDLWRLKTQVVAIALVLACGVAIFLTVAGMQRALEATLDDYYGRQRFADLFANAKRAPRSLVEEIRAIDGVRAAEARVAGWVVLNLPGRDAPASGRILSLPPDGAVLNIPLPIAGRMPDPDMPEEVAVSARFAEANNYRSGDRFEAIADGKRLSLTITGTLRSPEFIYALPPGGLMPDDEGFGVIWMPERTAAATFGQTGAFNDLAMALRRDADVRHVKREVDLLLDPWGGTGSYERDRQVSHSFIDAELSQLRSMALILPPIFFGIAAFLVNMVLGRVVTLERSEIGLLKALGYSKWEIALHYLLLAALVAVIGILLGWLVGTWLGNGMARLYAQFFDFPWLVRAGTLDVYAISGLIGLAAAGIGAIRAAMAAARLPAAVAMSPPAPPRFRRGIVDRMASALRLTQPAMMVLRGIMRWPLRSALTSLGLAFGVAVLVSSSFLTDAMDAVIDSAFFRSNRQHVVLALGHEASLQAVHDAYHLPGVLSVEPQFDLPITFHNGPRSKQAAISARPPGMSLVRTLDDQDRVVQLPEKGLLMSQSLARQLELQLGDTVLVEISDSREGTFEVPVTGITKQYLGLGAYMTMDALSRRLREDVRVTALNLWLDLDQLPAFRAAIKEMPALASAVMLTEVRDSFRDTIRENIRRNTILFVSIAVLITAGVAYNGARIQLSERARELASLRILGFTRAEVSSILLGETAVLALIAQPVGWAIGWAISWSMVNGFDSDLYRLPLVLDPASYANASLIALAATGAAALLVRRRLDKADLVAVLKTRE